MYLNHGCRISTGSSIIQSVEDYVPNGGITFSLQEYLHQFSISFEHEKGYGGGSGDSGGIISITNKNNILSELQDYLEDGANT